jgi:hypothetical protein
VRKVLFAIVLVGAAFAGGAAMNGPGLERLKAFIRAKLAPNDPAASDLVEVKGPPREVPAAPLPSLVPEGPAPTSLAMRPVRPGGPIAVAKPPLDDPGKAPTIALSPPPPRSEATPPDLIAPDPAPTDARTADPAVAAASRTEAPARDWSDLRRRMRTLGISRYEVDGEPGGRSRFRCLIPLAGRRAVAQQFEGEGDDDFQAAEAALRRVSLWRATEMAPP